MSAIGQTREVSMSVKKRKAKMQLIVDLRSDARSIAGMGLSENQKHFLRVGLALGKDLEPAGPMAGLRA
jgi:hypothetical protein